jgi:hypothetical protein
LDSSLGIATGYGMDGRGSIPGRGKSFFSTPQRPEQFWDLPSLLSNEYWGNIFPWIKQSGRETDSPPSSSEVNRGALSPLSHDCPHDIVLN